MAIDPAWNKLQRVVSGAVDGSNIVEEGTAAPVATRDGTFLPGGAPEIRVRNPGAVRILKDEPYEKPDRR